MTRAVALSLVVVGVLSALGGIALVDWRVALSVFGVVLVYVGLRQDY